VQDPLGGQHFALAAEAAAVLLLRSGRLDHRTHPGFAALVGQQRADERLAVDLVGLRPPPPARSGNRGRIDNVAFDPFALQHAMDPEAVQAGLLDCDDREVSARPRSRFLLELSEPFQQAGNIAGLNRMLRHLRPAARR